MTVRLTRLSTTAALQQAQTVRLTRLSTTAALQQAQTVRLTRLSVTVAVGFMPDYVARGPRRAGIINPTQPGPPVRL